MATPKAVPQDQLGQQLLTQILGGGNRTTSTINAGNVAPAMQVFNQASQPMDQAMLTALMSTIQQNAATNIPALTAALANATGSRSSNNSPLALALNQQNNEANNQALVAILENNLKQMGQANQAAGTIAQATRGTQQTQQTGVKNPMQMLIGGMLLNKADKSKVFDKAGKQIKDLFGGNTGTDPYMSPGYVDPAADAMQFSQLPDQSFSGYDLNNFADPAAFDFGGIDTLGSYDFSGYNDLSGFSDPAVFDFPIYDFSAYSDFSSIPTDAFFGFADGGQVGGSQGLSRRAVIDAQELSATRNIPMDQALREVLKMYAAPESYGTSLPQAAVDAAMNAPVMMQQGATPITSQTNSIPQVLMQLLMNPGKSPLNFEQRYADGGSLTGPGPGAPMVTRNRSNMGAAPRKARTNAAGGPGINSDMLSTMTSKAFGGAQQRMSPEEFAAMRDQMLSQRDKAEKDAMNKGLAVAGTNVAMSQIPVYGQIYSLANFFSKALGGPDFGERLYTWFDGPVGAIDSVVGPFADAGDELTSSIIEDAKDPLGSALDPGRPLEVVRNVFSKLGFADGGMIEGPGSGTSDSIVAKSKVPGVNPVLLSNKEYIIPADTVNMVGKEFFDNLLAATHTPVRR